MSSNMEDNKKSGANTISTRPAVSRYSYPLPATSISTSISTPILPFPGYAYNGVYTRPSRDASTATCTTFLASCPVVSATEQAQSNLTATCPTSIKVSWAQTTSSQVEPQAMSVTARKRKGWQKMQAALTAQVNNSSEDIDEEEFDVYGLRGLYQMSSEALYGAQMSATVDESQEEMRNDGRDVKVEVYRLPSQQKCQEESESNPSFSKATEKEQFAAKTNRLRAKRERTSAVERKRRAEELHTYRVAVEKARLELLNIRIERLRVEVQSKKAKLEQKGLHRKKNGE